MTDEEKKAAEAAKATADAKAEEAKKAAAASEEDEEVETEDDKGETLETLKAKNAKLQDENKKRRLSEKANKERMDRQDRALAILQGKEKADLDPILEAQKSANAKMARTMMKASVVALAKDAHDPALIFSAHAAEFKDIEVDIDNETVDEEAVKEKLDIIRKKSPFLFTSGTSQDTTIIKKNPDRSGTPGGGGSEYKQWQQLLGTGNSYEAQKFYNANRTKILTQMPKT